MQDNHQYVKLNIVLQLVNTMEMKSPLLKPLALSFCKMLDISIKDSNASIENADAVIL